MIWNDCIWAFSTSAVLAVVIVGALQWRRDLSEQAAEAERAESEPQADREYFVAKGRIKDALDDADAPFEGHMMTVEPFPTRQAAEIWYLTTMALRCSSGRVVRRKFISGNWVDVESWPIKQTVS